MRTLLACLVAFPLAACVPAPAPETDADCEWSYREGDTGPANWGRLCEPLRPYALCDTGTRQSPILLTGAQTANLPTLEFDYRSARFRVVEEYYDQELQAQAQDAASRLYLRVGTVTAESYRLVQFHFHHPCEHCSRQPPQFPMELHLVHWNDLNEVAVVGVFLREVVGATNPTFEAFLNAPLGSVATLQPLGLLPALQLRSRYVRYAGSLTTPACAEGVRWHVLQDPIDVPPGLISRFRARYPNTARPLKLRGGRPLLRRNN